MVGQNDAGAPHQSPSLPPSLTSSSSSIGSRVTRDLDGSPHIDIPGDPITNSEDSFPDVENLLANKPGHAPGRPCDHPFDHRFHPAAIDAVAAATTVPSQAPTDSSGFISPCSATAATAGDIITLLRALRDRKFSYRFRYDKARDFCDPECEFLERYVPWAEFSLVIRRLGLEPELGSSPARDEDDHTQNNSGDGTGNPPDHDNPDDRDIGEYINRYCRWEYTADQRFRIRMTESHLHHVLTAGVTELLFQRITTAANGLRAAGCATHEHGPRCDCPEDPDLPRLLPDLGPPLDLFGIPNSPGSDEHHKGLRIPDGAVRLNYVDPPPLVIEVGFSKPTSDFNSKEYISYGGANAVLVVNIPYMPPEQRLQVSDPAQVLVRVKLFRLVDVEVRDNDNNDSMTTTTTTTPTTTVYARPRLVSTQEDIPSTAPTNRGDAQLGLHLNDVYPDLPQSLPAEAQVNVSYRDIWDCVRPAWAAQRETDQKDDGSKNNVRVVQGRQVVVMSPSPDTSEADNSSVSS